MIRVALDGMGGDHAPAAEVEGLALALAELPATFRVQLVGRPEVLEPELARHPEIDRSRLDVIAAPDVIGMDEKPLQAVRKKPNSSLVVGLALQKEGKSDAYVSAGNTGAVLAASTLMLGLHEGVKRASVATPFPTADGAVLVLDGGANVDCTAAELVGFARLGTVYMRDILGRAEPAVGLLNVGEEDEKGNAAVREAHGLLKQAAGLRYIGNIEGRDILVGHAKWGQIDVVVCDGFVGNVVLKFYESVARLIVRLLKRDAPAILDREDIQKAFRTLDYSEYGGAPLLGVKGVSIIGHGSSGPTAIKNAIRVAVQSVEANLSRHIGEEFARREATASA
ncbi:MAG TPA: phosphate acyltransferase PlsX [Gemmatimonadales bacterium]|nr:phosphate acyltransferase PlsX [Gemmatimonadales bacterium]